MNGMSAEAKAPILSGRAPPQAARGLADIQVGHTHDRRGCRGTALRSFDTARREAV